MAAQKEVSLVSLEKFDEDASSILFTEPESIEAIRMLGAEPYELLKRSKESFQNEDGTLEDAFLERLAVHYELSRRELLEQCRQERWRIISLRNRKERTAINAAKSQVEAKIKMEMHEVERVQRREEARLKTGLQYEMRKIQSQAEKEYNEMMERKSRERQRRARVRRENQWKKHQKHIIEERHRQELHEAKIARRRVREELRRELDEEEREKQAMQAREAEIEYHGQLAQQANVERAARAEQNLLEEKTKYLNQEISLHKREAQTDGSKAITLKTNVLDKAQVEAYTVRVREKRLLHLQKRLEHDREMKRQRTQEKARKKAEDIARVRQQAHELQLQKNQEAARKEKKAQKRLAKQRREKAQADQKRRERLERLNRKREMVRLSDRRILAMRMLDLQEKWADRDRRQKEDKMRRDKELKLKNMEKKILRDHRARLIERRKKMDAYRSAKLMAKIKDDEHRVKEIKKQYSKLRQQRKDIRETNAHKRHQILMKFEQLKAFNALLVRAIDPDALDMNTLGNRLNYLWRNRFEEVKKLERQQAQMLKQRQEEARRRRKYHQDQHDHQWMDDEYEGESMTGEYTDSNNNNDNNHDHNNNNNNNNNNNTQHHQPNRDRHQRLLDAERHGALDPSAPVHSGSQTARAPRGSRGGRRIRRNNLRNWNNNNNNNNNNNHNSNHNNHNHNHQHQHQNQHTPRPPAIKAGSQSARRATTPKHQQSGRVQSRRY